MSTNCIQCGTNRRTSFDLICDSCRTINALTAERDELRAEVARLTAACQGEFASLEQVCEQNAQLHAKLAEAERDRDTMVEQRDELCRQTTEAEAQLAAAREDSARLDWLERYADHFSAEHDDYVSGQREEVSEGTRWSIGASIGGRQIDCGGEGATLRSAIDAALAAGEGK